MGKAISKIKKQKIFSNFVNFIKNNLILILILALAFFLRIYRIDELTTFGGDQGQDFLVVKNMVLYHKWTLLGIKTSGYSFFQGPVYLYMIYPFFVLFNLNPISGAIAAVFYSILTIIILYFLCVRFFSKRIAIISSLLFAVSGELIIFGNTPLYQHFLPLFIVISIYLFLIEDKNHFLYLLLGLSIGIGIELHLLNVTLFVALIVYLMVYEKNKLRNIFGYITGVILGLSPTIAFELRHDFLNTKYFLNFEPQNKIQITFFGIIREWFKGFMIYFGGNSVFLGISILLISLFIFFKKYQSKNFIKLKRLSIILIIVSILLSIFFSIFGQHYLIPFWLILLIIIPLGLENIFGKKVSTVIFTVLVIVNLMFSIGRLNYNHGYSMPEGWTLKKIVSTSKIISQDSLDHPNFNVAALLDAVTRAYPLRYAVEVYGITPESVENYPSNNYLYVVTNYNQEKMFEITTWEVTSFKPFEIGKTWDLQDGIYLYRLDRIRS